MDDRFEIRDIAAGITGDLMSYLDSVGWLGARVSSDGLAATYSLATTLRAQGDRLRIQARLTDANGREVYVFKLDGSLADSFDWQDEAGAKLVTVLLSSVVVDPTAFVQAIPERDRDAAHWVLWSLAGGVVPTSSISATY